MALVDITFIPRTTGGWQSDNAAAAVREDAVGGRVLHPSTVQILGEGFPERFWVFVQKTETCWLWTAGKNKDGYGQIARSGGRTPISTHRAVWILAHGPIPSRQHVLHKCDVRNCVNPDHLFLGDQAANMKDAAAKGRLAGNPRPHGRRLSSQAEQDLLAEFAKYPNRRLPNGMRRQLAQRFGLSEAYVSMLGRGIRVRAKRSA
jgi:hypothetical protein